VSRILYSSMSAMAERNLREAYTSPTIWKQKDYIPRTRKVFVSLNLTKKALLKKRLLNRVKVTAS